MFMANDRMAALADQDYRNGKEVFSMAAYLTES